MRALIIGPEERTAIDKVVAYAMEPEHWYIIGGPVPGENPEFVVHIPDGFRCVFTFTRNQDKLFRHLTVSVPGQNYPSPEACVMIAEAFGFTSTGQEFDIVSRLEKDGWMVSPGHADEHCIVVVQPVPGGLPAQTIN